MSINFRNVLLSLLVVAMGAMVMPMALAAAPSRQDAVCDGADYSVQATDWLSKLADKNYGDVLAYPRIMEATNLAADMDSSYATIEDPDIIEIGWKLCIPGVEVASSFVDDEIAAESAPKDIVEIAVSDGRFNTLVAAVTAADLVDTLKGEGPFTVFAPTDDAFATLPAGTLEGLLSDIPALTDILLYHVVSGKVMVDEVTGLSAATTVQGDDVAISVEGDSVMINQATVIITDIEATNGVIHVVDAVILPPAEEAAATPAPTPVPVEEESPAPELDIIDTAKADGRFNVLISNLETTKLDRVLQGVGPFTVFAPTDDAFTTMPVDVLAGLLLDSNALKQALLYHVVSGKVMAADVAALDSATTLQRGELEITMDGDDVLVNGIKVIITDIEATNGVIHVIDGVLVP